MSRVEHEIIVDAPADEVYRAWRDFESFPTFMTNVEHVREIGYGRSHWRSKGPLGQRAEWDAQLVVDEPARAIAWRSLEGAGVRTQGAVRFEEANGATRLHVTLSYDAPMRPLGGLATRIFANPDKQVAADLTRFKALLESGSANGSAVAGRSMWAGGGTGSSGAAVGNASVSPGVRPWDTLEDHHSVQGKYPTNTGCAEPPYGPGMSNDESVRGGPHSMSSASGLGGSHAPTSTGTPGGTLGAPVEDDLKRDQQTFSERTDTR